MKRRRKLAASKQSKQEHERARCAPPIDAALLSPETRAAIVEIVAGFDAVREKHHPGALLRGDVEPSLLIDFDDGDEDEP